MFKFKLNKYKDSCGFLWDNDDNTLKDINEYLSVVKGDQWSAGRCYNEKTNENDLDTLYISESDSVGTCSSFYKVGTYLLDFGDVFRVYHNDEDLKRYIEVII